MSHQIGPLQKMSLELADPVKYWLPVGSEQLLLNEQIGKRFLFNYTGKIYCIQCGRVSKKSFQQGYCFPCWQRLQECHLCLLRPERCLVEQGLCPEDDWAHAQCHVEHIVYLANSSTLKVGITRSTNVPGRWLDQGAVQALPIFRAANRYQAGVMEVLLKQRVSDKTAWQTMLKQQPAPIDLIAKRDQLLAATAKECAELLTRYPTIKPLADAEPVSWRFPWQAPSGKIHSYSFDKTASITGFLLGMKGQYLIFDSGVLNVRKFGGYVVSLTVEDK